MFYIIVKIIKSNVQLEHEENNGGTMMPPKKSEAEGDQVQVTLKDRILGELQSEEFEIKKREVHVMTRLSADLVKIIDTLVELEVFRSRSEAVSSYVEKSIYEQMDLYQDVIEYGEKLAEMREAAKRIAFGTMKEK